MTHTRTTRARTTRARTLLVPLALSALLLAGCGTTSAPTDATNEQTATGGESITVTDDLGNEVTLENGPAQEIVALEWEQAEILSSLGVELAGVSDPEGYTSWAANSTPLIGEPADVGVRGEPSVETIAELEPDLIVGVEGSIPESVSDQMSQIAPVLLLGASDLEDPLGAVANVVETYGIVSGQSAAATALLDEFDSHLAENAQKIEDAGAAGTPVVFTSIYAESSNVTFRLEGSGSASMAVMLELGLAQGWSGDVDEYGMSYSDVEGLTTLSEDTWLFYWANAASDDPVSTLLAENAIWSALPIVANEQVLGLGDGVWLYGGPNALMAFSDEVTAAVTGE